MRSPPLAALTLALAPLLAGAATPAGDPPGSMRAARLQGRVRVDGRLDEAAWAAAPAFSDFVQSFPDEGKPGTERTEVRVLYDARTLYVGVRCWDSGPVVHGLGRRDQMGAADSVMLVIDSNSDRRTAALFALTAGNVQVDGQVFDDDRTTTEWDAVWDGAAALLPDGWSAEFSIPLSVLRFPEAAEQRWGFGVQRVNLRTHEKSASVLFPRGGRGTVSRLGVLSGLEGVEPGLHLEVTPYLAARARRGPLHSDPSSPTPRVTDLLGDLGADVAARLGPRLNLAAAINPDFGQVEADQIILNLSTFEPYFPEKRPFFNHGLDLFQPPGAGNEQVPQQMFYSRRIGLDAPILGAAKLVGQASDRIQVGLLDALVSGTGQAHAAEASSVFAAEQRAGRGLRWSWAEPLHLGADRTYPVVTPAPVNHLAGVVRAEVADRLYLGVQGTSALPLRSCRLSQAELDTLPDLNQVNQVPGACLARGGHALALDLSATSADGEWYAYGQADASRVEGGPPLTVLPDGIGLRPGDAGAGGYLRAGRRGGEPWRLALSWSYASPRLDLNPSGYQRTQNEQEAKVVAGWTHPKAEEPWHEWTLQAGGYARWTTDGRGLARGRGAWLYAEGWHRATYGWGWAKLAFDDAQYDVREISGSGIPLRRPGWATLLAGAASDDSRPLYVSVEGNVSRNVTLATLGRPWGWNVNGEVAYRPHPRVETRLAFVAELSSYAIRYLGEPADLGLPDDEWRRRNWPAGTRFFGSLRAPDLSLVLRQQVVLTPRLTFQAYAQLFAAAGRFGSYWTAMPNGTAPIEADMLRPVALPAGASRYDFHQSRLVLNAVLRWEVRPGSVVYVVYARDQAELPYAGPGVPAASVFPRALGPGATTDTFLVKWSVWLGT